MHANMHLKFRASTLVEVGCKWNKSLLNHKIHKKQNIALNKMQISLHTRPTSLQFKETNTGPVKTKSFCLFSRNLSHDPVAIVAHLQPVFQYINKIKSRLRAIHFLSDSPSNQYRNKFYLFSHSIKESFHNLKHSTWNYCGAGHG